MICTGGVSPSGHTCTVETRLPRHHTVRAPAMSGSAGMVDNVAVYVGVALFLFALFCAFFSPPRQFMRSHHFPRLWYMVAVVLLAARSHELLLLLHAGATRPSPRQAHSFAPARPLLTAAAWCSAISDAGLLKAGGCQPGGAQPMADSATRLNSTDAAQEGGGDVEDNE